jgi:hypothetical protein
MKVKVIVTVGESSQECWVPDGLISGPASPFKDMQQNIAMSNVGVAFVNAYKAEYDRKKAAE